MVSEEVTGPDLGVTVSGENEQLQPLGKPVQESETGLLNAPDCGLAVTCTFPDRPAGIVTEDGDALRETSGAPPPVPQLGL